MVKKTDLFELGNALRDAEKALEKLHKMAWKLAFKYKDELGLKKDEGDFTVMSGGTPKPDPK